MKKHAIAVLSYGMALSLLLCSCSSSTPKAAPPSMPDMSFMEQSNSAAEAQPQSNPRTIAPTEQRPLANTTPIVQSTPVPEAPAATPAPAPQAAPVVPQPAAEQPAMPKVKPKTNVPPASHPAKVTTSQSQRLTLSQLVKKYPDLLRLKGSSNSKSVALTFDDAPDETYTPQVLDILKKHHVRATFFLLGVQAVKHPAIVKRIANEGHVIGNHSYNHKLFTKLSDDVFRLQIQNTQKELHKLIGYSPRLLRPPYGEISESQLIWASDQGFTIVNWNVDSLDWKQLGASQVSANILNHTHGGSIILQHSGGGPGQNLSGTVKALPNVIQTLKDRGYNLVTLPDLLQVPKDK
ncbi:polysaccharide deacetylase family protein [Paenibacillus cremeus]|uniref:Polysaccharide deacetylase family protein n=1 Tax=Paenibacillus cremeus TaxID=2163881 RepID=A0A559K071_9BACL|nr:polysaccharide deacetylase family protein [Paenibacillus cremeus]TVY05531.1 polysaccharide deacetylase family protein [Paenibacillus cremeus]